MHHRVGDTQTRRKCQIPPSLPRLGTTCSGSSLARAYRVCSTSPGMLIWQWWRTHQRWWSTTGSTFRATHIYTGQVVALKVQAIDVSYPSNPHERKIYPLLQGGVGMPTLWASGLWGRWDYLAMDLLGNSLDRLYRKTGKNVMDLRSTCSIAIQLVRHPSPSLVLPSPFRRRSFWSFIRVDWR